MGKCLKIWMDVLTGKQLLFAEPMIRRLERKNSVLCTARDYRELNSLARIRKVRVRTVGRHGGKENLSKLVCSARRIEELAGLVSRFGPDVAVSFPSPEAARVAFGLGIRHIGFADSPHATAVTKLTVPYLDKLLTPWIMKESYSRYGIPQRNIVPYRAIDAAVISKRAFSKRLRLRKNGSKVIMVRMAEGLASYNEFPDTGIIPIIDKLLERLPGFKVVVLPRYAEQIKLLRARFGRKITVVQKVPDSKDILRYADVFIGSGGTMTAEAAFLGIPSISYSKRRVFDVELFLEKRRIIVRESDPEKIPGTVERLLGEGSLRRERARKLLKTMEDPFLVLQKTIKS